MVLGALTPAAFAQEVDEIITTGIRGSLERSMDIKRNSSGVVDAISAEDIGKFPNTNLAESLQRISGVSINRVNGEGSEVTVRGFGGGFNLVTLNGRTMPTTNVVTVGGDQGSDFAGGDSRSFDFSNLASEGVSGLEVYKTGRASIPSGGLGATINIKTARPLDNPGMKGTIGIKAMHDTGVERGSDVTPEISGLFSWTDPQEKFGIAIFGSYQKRETTTRSASVNGWNINRGSFFLDPANGRINAATQVTNAPAADQLVSYPNDSRYHLSEIERERINGQITLQFRPTDTLTLTGDFSYAKNEVDEQRTDQTNWFNRPFGQVTFDGNSDVSTTVILQETLNGVKDIGFEQQYRATKDTLESFGFNAEWEASDKLTFVLDAHTSESKALPNNPNGASSTLVSMGAPVIAAHSVDFTSGFPVQQYTLNDALRGNGNGVLDVGDLGSQIARTIASSQLHKVEEIRLDGAWDINDRFRLDFGGDYRTSKMTQLRFQTQQTLGDWGINNPGDVNQFAAGLVEEYCLSCLFDDYAPGDASVAFRANAADLYNALSAAYVSQGNAVGVTNDDFNQVEEDIWATYAQLSVETNVMGRPAHFVAGLRYENTEVLSSSIVAVPTNIIWAADNDFVRTVSSSKIDVSQAGSYDNWLPSVDFSVEVTDDIVGRVSWSNTLARPGYGSLFVADVANNPPRPTALGGIASGTSGNPGLLPLVSSNFDASIEWYYAPSSYVSVGFYNKQVKNFEGRGQTTRNLFGLRDPSSGAAGTRSGDALAELAVLGADPTDVNMFTMTALIDQLGSVAAASAVFQANFVNGSLAQAFVDATFGAYDVVANANDPLFQFEVTQPINNRKAEIYGFEIAIQHFFGDSGFGVAGSYTNVNGDVEIDNGADPSVDQFALLGLSDTYNITGIYEKNGLSARVSYNWRDEFLAQTNRGGGNRNPVYNEAFGQLDFNISYDVTERISVSFEGINLTQEGTRTYGRDVSNVWFAQELDARYLLGARYKF
ncbi:MAG: TonB-dependent receptor [Robiginitomaculum sp.]|nr:MAG: TonB-dependent receptor [Robiginitomaculum sp.]